MKMKKHEEVKIQENSQISNNRFLDNHPFIIVDDDTVPKENFIEEYEKHNSNQSRVSNFSDGHNKKVLKKNLAIKSQQREPPIVV